MRKTIHETISKVGIVAVAAFVLLVMVSGVITTIISILNLLEMLIVFVGTLPKQLRSVFNWFVSNPFILISILLVVGFIVFVIRNRSGEIEIDAGSIVSKCRELLENNIGYFDADVVRGSIEHDDVRWIGRYKRSGGIRVGPRACLSHGIKLRPAMEHRTKARSPNTSMRADEKTSEYEDRAWENIAEREKVENETMVDVLACPYDSCPFSIPEDEYHARDEDAVRTQFENHFKQMRTGDSDPFVKWRTRAEERREFEPTPADIWDTYVPECDDPAVITNGSRFEETEKEGDSSVTCEELENYKKRAEGTDRVIELLPSGLDILFEFIFRSNYLKEKEKIREMMNQERKTCRESLQRIEQAYGSTVERTVTARHRRDEPPIDNKVAERELGEAGSEVRELYTELRSKYLSYDMRSWLSVIEDDIYAADEYIRELNNFTEYKENIEPQIEEFEQRFEPYEDVEEYMTTNDYTVLDQMESIIHQKLLDLHREVQLDLLPPDDTNWANKQKARFTELLRLLPDYNETFVERERERYRELFETEHGSLNDEQQKAIVRNDHHNLVDASAGTGKTLTLTYRFLYLYRRGVPLDDIVAITFARDAANEMKERIANELDGVDQDQLNVSTCHSLANGIVKDSVGGYTNDNNDFINIYKRYAKGFLHADNAIQERHSDLINTFKEYHKSLLEETDVYKRKPENQSLQKYLCDQYTEFLKNARDDDQTPTEIRERLTDDKLVQYLFGRAACAILTAFLDYAESSEEPVDFFDMVESATRIGRENPEHFGGRYQHILFDEFQDVTESDLAFVETFLQGPGDTRLFAVGDDWQSIYGFRGSDPRYFLEFDQRFEGVENTQLAVNYRCPPAVVEAGVELMDNCEEDQNKKAVEAFDDSETVPVVHKLDGIYKSRIAGYVVDLVEDALCESDMDSTDVMVLSRNITGTQYVNSIRSVLAEREIPVDNSGKREDPNGVRVQTIHTSKGTESECVILVNATDITLNGLPASEKENELIKPATIDRVDHYAEERRLCYVALTRTENQFHVVTRAGQESRYLNDIYDFSDEKQSVVTTVEGTVSQWDDPGANARKPITATLICDDYNVNLKSRHRYLPQELEEGRRYRLSNFDVEDNGYGEEIVLNEKIEIKELQPQ